MAEDMAGNAADHGDAAHDEGGADRRRLGLARGTAITLGVALIAGGLFGAERLFADPGGAEDGGASAGGAVAEPAPMAPSDEGGGSTSSFAGVTLRLAQTPADAPEFAPAYTLTDVSRERARELAAVLGVEGEVRDGGDAGWAVTGAEPGGMSLTVGKRGPGHWSFSPSAVALPAAPPGAEPGTADEPVPPREPTDAMEIVPGAPGDPDAPATSGAPDGPGAPVEAPGMPPVDGTPPPTPGEATEAAGPLLDALGLGDATVVTDATSGSQRIVRAVPEVAGLPVHGLDTEIWIGPDGSVFAAHGALLPGPEEGEEYAVPPAEDAVTEYNGLIGGDAQPADATARFGLSTLPLDDGGTVLAPSWLFTYTLPSGERLTTSQPAVPRNEAEAPAEPGGPGEPVEPGAPDEEPGDTGWSIAPYEPSDRTLTLTFWGGVCSDYAATARESDSSITVSLESTTTDPELACIAVAEEQTTEVALDGPAGEKELLDSRGEPLPVR
ncbi:hypothetical protein [Streptomyces radicis]|uniref:hypothetical protein n=1 Tax=Streptomyces radicis TaxID=1750517 RepID=UPI001603E925|nr:hypothetical protein [Streptomyces radicis]